MVLEGSGMAIINRLRFVDILTPGLGDQASRDFAEALQDEMEPLAGDQAIKLLMAQIDARFAQMEARMWRWALAIVGLNLTAIGIATGAIIALN